MRVTVVQYNSDTPSSDYLQEDKDFADKQYELGPNQSFEGFTAKKTLAS
jgi:hypothetical protein